jgi:hypothetical protein
VVLLILGIVLQTDRLLEPIMLVFNQFIIQTEQPDMVGKWQMAEETIGGGSEIHGDQVLVHGLKF